MTGRWSRAAHLIRVRRRQDAGVDEIAQPLSRRLKSNDDKQPFPARRQAGLARPIPSGFAVYAGWRDQPPADTTARQAGAGDDERADGPLAGVPRCRRGRCAVAADGGRFRFSPGDPAGVEPDPDAAAVPRGLRGDGADRGVHAGPRDVFRRRRDACDPASKRGDDRDFLNTAWTIQAMRGCGPVASGLCAGLADGGVLWRTAADVSAARRQPDAGHSGLQSDAHGHRQPASGAGSADGSGPVRTGIGHRGRGDPGLADGVGLVAGRQRVGQRCRRSDRLQPVPAGRGEPLSLGKDRRSRTGPFRQMDLSVDGLRLPVSQATS